MTLKLLYNGHWTLHSDNEDRDKDCVDIKLGQFIRFFQGQFDSRCEEVLRGQDSISEMPCLQIELNCTEGNFWFALCVLWLLQS